MSNGEFRPCSWCGSTGECEHLAAVLEIPNNVPIPVRARGGLAQAKRAAARVMVAWALKIEGAALEAAVRDERAVLDERGEGEGGAVVFAMWLALIGVLVYAVLAGILHWEFFWPFNRFF